MGKIDTKVKDRLILEELGETLLAKIIDIAQLRDDLLISESMIVVPVKYEDGSFKNKTIGGNWQFFPEYAYVGARGDIIFGFSTPDQVAEEGKPLWAMAELNPKKLDDVFPLLMPELATRMGIEKTPKLMSDLIDQLYSKRAISDAMEMETAEDKLRANPLFGLF